MKEVDNFVERVSGYNPIILRLISCAATSKLLHSFAAKRCIKEFHESDAHDLEIFVNIPTTHSMHEYSSIKPDSMTEEFTFVHLFPTLDFGRNRQ